MRVACGALILPVDLPTSNLFYDQVHWHFQRKPPTITLTTRYHPMSASKLTLNFLADERNVHPVPNTPSPPPDGAQIHTDLSTTTRDVPHPLAIDLPQRPLQAHIHNQPLLQSRDTTSGFGFGPPSSNVRDNDESRVATSDISSSPSVVCTLSHSIPLHV